MPSRTLYAILITALLGSGMFIQACDDIYEMPESNNQQKEIDTGPESVKKQLSIEDMEKMLTFLRQTRFSMMNKMEELRSLKVSNEARFIEERSKFATKIESMQSQLNVRRSWLDMAGKDHPPEHPVTVLRGAAVLLKLEINDSMRFLYDQKRLDPDLRDRLTIQLDKARESVGRYREDHPEETIPLKESEE